jgi:FlaA1/EpsC-like NDP-sugar epimerase
LKVFKILNGATNWLRERRPLFKVSIVVAVDLILLVLAVISAYMLRISALELPVGHSFSQYFIAPLLSIFSMTCFKIYHSASRSYSFHVERQIVFSQLIILPVWALFIVFVGVNGFARSVIFIYFILAVITLSSIRRLAALMFHSRSHTVPHRDRVPVLIYGAGREAIILVDSLNRQGRYRPVAFVETDYTLIGRKVHGLSVFGTETLLDVIDKFKAKEVMIAKPQQNRASRRVLVDMFLNNNLQVKLIPGLEEIVEGRIDLSALRPVNLEDLLGRDPVPPDRHLMESAVKDQTILITGAGGSIGSELVRQAANYGPRKIIMVDNNEFSLFEIHREMESLQKKHPEFPILVQVLADVQNKSFVSSLIENHTVDVVFHAAAYKHVRMVQENAAAGIWNNVWGTLNLAEAAMNFGVKLFVMVSTDKAVRPTGVMGASKRVAEMIVQAMARCKKNKTIFTMVRFGNVLGSTGSVVPLFQEQILKGGPVYVTHPDVTRYFMLIPEAAQLVIQSGAMAAPGEVFVLDMGESVKILTLAHTMIELAGMTPKTKEQPNGDIEIIFTGLREGEKLFEELQIGRDVSSTPNPRIMRSNEFYLPLPKILTELKKLEANLLQNKIDNAIKIVMNLASQHG